MPEKSAAERILAAAAELFSERGYAATTTRALAERADVNEVTIFRLFGSKGGVLGGLWERISVEGAASEAAREPLPDDLRAALTELARREVASAMSFGAIGLRLAFEAKTVPELAAMIGQGTGDNAKAMRAYFAEQQKAGRIRDDIDPGVLAEAFFSLTSSMAMSRQVLAYDPTPGVGVEEAVGQLVEVLLSGIETRG